MCSMKNISFLVISPWYSKSPPSESSVLFDFSNSSKVLAALHERDCSVSHAPWKQKVLRRLKPSIHSLVQMGDIWERTYDGAFRRSAGATALCVAEASRVPLPGMKFCERHLWVGSLGDPHARLAWLKGRCHSEEDRYECDDGCEFHLWKRVDLE